MPVSNVLEGERDGAPVLRILLEVVQELLHHLEEAVFVGERGHLQPG